jgi:transcriptional regulator with XRE-family HTH domain
MQVACTGCKLRYGVPVSAEERAPRATSVADALRRLRERDGRTSREVAEALGWSPAKLSRIETRRSGVKRIDLDRLLEIYGAGPDVRAEIGDLLTSGTRTGPNAFHAVPDAVEKYAKLEARASRISMYGAAVIPGLLQTAEYAMAIIQATPVPEEHLAQDRLDVRMLRQGVFGHPFRLDVVIDEAVLHRVIGGKDLMRRQMRRLGEIGDRPDTTIRLLPFAVGAHPALAGQFTILDFDDGGQTPPQVHSDGLTGGMLRSAVDDVRRYRGCFEMLQTLALSVEQSAEIFANTPA